MIIVFSTNIKRFLEYVLSLSGEILKKGLILSVVTNLLTIFVGYNDRFAVYEKELINL